MLNLLKNYANEVNEKQEENHYDFLPVLICHLEFIAL
jgi:hypothetical protein